MLSGRVSASSWRVPEHYCRNDDPPTNRFTASAGRPSMGGPVAVFRALFTERPTVQAAPPPESRLEAPCGHRGEVELERKGQIATFMHWLSHHLPLYNHIMIAFSTDCQCQHRLHHQITFYRLMGTPNFNSASLSSPDARKSQFRRFLCLVSVRHVSIHFVGQHPRYPTPYGQKGLQI